MFLAELSAYLVAQGVAASTSIFLGANAALPPGEGPFLSIIETGGMGSTFIQNQAAGRTHQPTAQILCRAATYGSARTLAAAAHAALNGVWNTELSGVLYQKIICRQDPTDVGLDVQKRPMVSFNIEVEKNPS